MIGREFNIMGVVVFYLKFGYSWPHGIYRYMIVIVLIIRSNYIYRGNTIIRHYDHRCIISLFHSGFLIYYLVPNIYYFHFVNYLYKHHHSYTSKNNNKTHPLHYKQQRNPSITSTLPNTLLPA